MSKRVKVPLSSARARLFELAELVRESGDDTVVVLEHRGSREQVALVRETQLAYLETKVQELEKRVQRPFTLAGSLASDLDDGAVAQALREIRQGWTSHPYGVAPARTKKRKSRA